MPVRTTSIRNDPQQPPTPTRSAPLLSPPTPPTPAPSPGLHEPHGWSPCLVASGESSALGQEGRSWPSIPPPPCSPSSLRGGACPLTRPPRGTLHHYRREAGAGALRTCRQRGMPRNLDEGCHRCVGRRWCQDSGPVPPQRCAVGCAVGERLKRRWKPLRPLPLPLLRAPGGQPSQSPPGNGCSCCRGHQHRPGVGVSGSVVVIPREDKTVD